MGYWEVRTAQPADVDGIRTVAERGWHTAYADILAEETRERALAAWYDAETVRRTIEREDGGYFVAEQAGEVVGYASTSPGEEQHVATLDSIYVRPDRWGDGIGTALLSAVEAFCRDNGFETLRIGVLEQNEVGRSFYRKHSYEVVDERTGDLFGETATEKVLRGPL